MHPTIVHLKMAPRVPLLMSPRDAAICERYHDVQSAELVGNEFNVSAERVRQLYRSAQRRIGQWQRLARRARQ